MDDDEQRALEEATQAETQQIMAEVSRIMALMRQADELYGDTQPPS